MTDVKMLKSYLLGATKKLTDVDAADLDGNKKITVADLALLKIRLLSQKLFHQLLSLQSQNLQLQSHLY